MGRYWNSNNHSGKFGFAVQNSSDPEIFGMQEQEPASITYYLDDSDEAREDIKKVLDEQYEILHIKPEDRIYEIKDEQEIWDLLDKYHEQNYRPYDKEKDKDQIPFWSAKYESGEAPVDKRVPLAECRVSLGLKIMDDLMKDGYCELEAEL